MLMKCPCTHSSVIALFREIAVSIASVGLPGQVSFFAAVGPICLAMGLPLGVLPLLLAVEVIPDIFRTVGNVTADMGVTRIIDRLGATPVGFNLREDTGKDDAN